MDQTRTLESFLAHVQQRDPHQSEFAQAVREVMTTLNKIRATVRCLCLNALSSQNA